MQVTHLHGTSWGTVVRCRRELNKNKSVPSKVHWKIDIHCSCCKFCRDIFLRSIFLNKCLSTSFWAGHSHISPFETVAGQVSIETTFNLLELILAIDFVLLWLVKGQVLRGQNWFMRENVLHFLFTYSIALKQVLSASDLPSASISFSQYKCHFSSCLISIRNDVKFVFPYRIS